MVAEIVSLLTRMKPLALSNLIAVLHAVQRPFRWSCCLKHCFSQSWNAQHLVSNGEQAEYYVFQVLVQKGQPVVKRTETYGRIVTQIKLINRENLVATQINNKLCHVVDNCRLLASCAIFAATATSYFLPHSLILSFILSLTLSSLLTNVIAELRGWTRWLYIDHARNVTHWQSALSHYPRCE